MMNGEINGFHNSLIEEDCFLFTSESVGEGHPGKARHAGLFCFTYQAALEHCFKVVSFLPLFLHDTGHFESLILHKKL